MEAIAKQMEEKYVSIFFHVNTLFAKMSTGYAVYITFYSLCIYTNFFNYF